MKLNQELSQVLKMIEAGTITAEEGQKLIQAMDKNQLEKKPIDTTSTGRFLKIEILTKKAGEKEDVQIKFPLSLAKVFLKTGVVQKQLKAKLGEEIDLKIDDLLLLVDSQSKEELMTIDTNNAQIHISIE